MRNHSDYSVENVLRRISICGETSQGTTAVILAGDCFGPHKSGGSGGGEKQTTLTNVRKVRETYLSRGVGDGSNHCIRTSTKTRLREKVHVEF